jgi:ParB-like chromosome segregation protein Spo0J
MAGKFNLGELIAQGRVSKLDTGADVSNLDTRQIELIDLDQIDDDPANFYALTDLDALAENIELLGLQQPLLVRPNPETPGRVIIISGHRRRAAIRKLVEDGREDLRKIPCIREAGAGSAALQELRLIYANSDTRKLSDAEISKQAERVEALLYQLKEEGYKFPGRMRDHVAEACKVSASKLARLKVIREGLIEAFSVRFEAGQLTEQTAYTLARLPWEVQLRIADKLPRKGRLRCIPVERLIQMAQDEPEAWDKPGPKTVSKDEPAERTQEFTRWVPVRFQDGMPHYEGPYYCRMKYAAEILLQTAWWDEAEQQWRTRQAGAEVCADCLGWYPLPEDEEDNHA